MDVQELLGSDDWAGGCDLLLSLGHALLSAGDFRRVIDAVAPETFTLAGADCNQAHRTVSRLSG